MTDKRELDDQERATLDAITRPIELAPDVLQVWKQLPDNTPVQWTKASITYLQIAIDRINTAVITTTNIANAIKRGDLDDGYSAFVKMGSSLVEAQNSFRQVISLIASGREIPSEDKPREPKDG